MSIKTATIASITTLDLASTAEFDLVSHICRRFHREGTALYPEVLEGTFRKEDIKLPGGNHITGVPGELDSIREVHTKNQYDYLDYGDGIEGDTEDLQEMLEELEADNIVSRLSIRKAVLDTKARIERSKQRDYSGPRFSWAEAWSETKVEMKSHYDLIRKNDALMRTIQGELKARSHDSQPWLTTYSTSDMCGPSRVDTAVTTYDMDPAVHGMYAQAHSGDILAGPKKKRITASPAVMRRKRK